MIENMLGDKNSCISSTFKLVYARLIAKKPTKKPASFHYLSCILTALGILVISYMFF